MSKSRKCDYGCGRKAKHQFKNGVWCCSEYSCQCPEIRKENTGNALGLKIYRKTHPHPRPMLGVKPWNFGLTKETDERVKKMSDSLKERCKRDGFWNNTIISDEQKKKLSRIQKERIKNGCKIGCGHAKKYWHESPIAGKVSLDGTWELRVAIFFDGSELNWRRNTKLFEYNKQDGSIGYYKPDFYVYDWGTYIEVKGWEDEDDKLKWSKFPKPLEVWNGDKLVEYGILISKW